MLQPNLTCFTSFIKMNRINLLQCASFHFPIGQSSFCPKRKAAGVASRRWLASLDKVYRPPCWPPPCWPLPCWPPCFSRSRCCRSRSCLSRSSSCWPPCCPEAPVLPGSLGLRCVSTVTFRYLSSLAVQQVLLAVTMRPSLCLNRLTRIGWTQECFCEPQELPR